MSGEAVDPGLGLLLKDLVSVGTVGLCLGLVGVAFQRMPDSRLARPLEWMVASVAFWTVGDTITLFSRDMLIEQLGIAILYTGAIFLPACWWRLVLTWCQERSLPFALRLAPRRRAWIWPPFVFAGVMWLVLLSNPLHGLYLTPVIGSGNVLGPFWFVAAVPSYALMTLSAVVLAGAVATAPAPGIRREAGFLLASCLVTLVWHMYAVLFSNASWHGTVSSLAVSSALVVLGLHRDHLFGVLPVAFRAIVENDADGLVILGPGDRVLYANPTARELLVPWPLLHGTKVDLASLPAIECPGGADLRLAPDGQRHLAVSPQVVRDRGQRTRLRSIRIHDATQERETELELTRAERLRSLAELARGVAHDFSNLLVVIGGNVELLADTIDDSPPHQRRLSRIRLAARQAGDLASQLRLYAGADDRQREVVDLGALVNDAVLVHGPDVGQPLQLGVDLAERSLFVWADETKLRQVIQNLLVNAAESLPEEGGHVEVATGCGTIDPASLPKVVMGRERPADRYAFVRVSDTGSGMDRATRERIFDPFFGTKGKDRGLGLAIVMGFVRSHDAVLTLESTPGRGSRFTVYLPCEAPGED